MMTLSFFGMMRFSEIMTADVPRSSDGNQRRLFFFSALSVCRIGDYLKLSMSNIAITDDGIPYVQYLPKKTEDTE